MSSCPGRYLGIIAQNPSVSKSNRLHVVIFRIFFSKLRYIPKILMDCFPGILNFQSVISQSQPVHLQLAVGSPRSLISVVCALQAWLSCREASRTSASCKTRNSALVGWPQCQHTIGDASFLHQLNR